VTICCINEEALDVVYAHCARATRGRTREEAALLYGLPCIDRGFNPFTWIWLAVPAVTTASATHVEIREESFLEAEERVASPEASVLGRRPILVGWAHSHPFDGPGSVFMSGTDRETMRLRFPRDHHVGLVLDPKSGHWGVFGWVDRQVAPVAARVVRDPDWKRHFWCAEVAP